MRRLAGDPAPALLAAHNNRKEDTATLLLESVGRAEAVAEVSIQHSRIATRLTSGNGPGAFYPCFVVAFRRRLKPEGSGGRY